MCRESKIIQEQLSQHQQHRVYKITKNMAPTRNTYSLRSKGLPTIDTESLTRTTKVPTQVTENNESDAIEVQVPAKAVIDTFQPLISVLTSQVMQLSTALEEQRVVFTRQYEALQTEFTNLKAEIATSISTQLSGVYVPAPASNSSYAAAAESATLGTLPQKSQPLSRPSNLTPNSTSRTLTMSDIPHCTIDTSRVDESKQQEVQPGAIRLAIEKEIRTKQGSNWRCAAVMRDPRNNARIRVACRDEKEQKAVKQAAEKAKVEGVRVLRDQLFPVKIDGVNRCAVLDEHSQVRPDITEKLGKENEVEIAKLAWLSKKDNQKAYGSMVIYVTKGSDARRLLQDQFFHVAGESGWTSVFKPFSGPTQCYNCQEIGHKAFNCKKSQVCGKCAKEGHHHKDCIDNAIPKCVPCGGPHESFSRSCHVLYPPSHE
jgi:hypothetical protein